VSVTLRQVQQKGYDTHSNQKRQLETKLSDLKAGVFSFVRAAESCGFWDDVLVTTFSDFGRRFAENSRKGTDHGWSSYMFVFGNRLRKKVFGFSHNHNSSALEHIIPFHEDAYDIAKQTKGDLYTTTRLETWNACLLAALALPAIPRLGRCPPELQIREHLADVPIFDETKYYKTETVLLGTGEGSPEGNFSILDDGDMTHLDTPLSPSEVLQFARRVGYSARSHGLDAYTVPSVSSYTPSELTLAQAISLAMTPDAYSHSNASLDNYVYPTPFGIQLWKPQGRERRNVWDLLRRLPYPRLDPIERKARRFDVYKYFDWTASRSWRCDSTPTEALEVALATGCWKIGPILVAAEYVGREDEILQRMWERSGQFFYPHPVDASTSKPNAKLLQSNKKLKPGSAAKIDWALTILYTSDQVMSSSISPRDVVEDWKCPSKSNATRGHSQVVLTPTLDGFSTENPNQCSLHPCSRGVAWVDNERLRAYGGATKSYLVFDWMSDWSWPDVDIISAELKLYKVWDGLAAGHECSEGSYNYILKMVPASAFNLGNGQDGIAESVADLNLDGIPGTVETPGTVQTRFSLGASLGWYSVDVTSFVQQTALANAGSSVLVVELDLVEWGVCSQLHSSQDPAM
jgi:hypothetical protein